jgi:hypothetical protein
MVPWAFEVELYELTMDIWKFLLFQETSSFPKISEYSTSQLWHDLGTPEVLTKALEGWVSCSLVPARVRSGLLYLRATSLGEVAVASYAKSCLELH